jgi:hypothetical protein
MRPAGTVSEEQLRSSGTVAGSSMRSATAADPEEIMLDATAAQWIHSHAISPLCTLIGSQFVAGVGVAGCAVAGVDLGLR